METRTKIGISAAVVSTMAAAAAAYMYLGKEAPTRRKKMAAWMRKAERDIVRETMRLKDAAFTEENFERIVEAVTNKYRQAQNLSAEDIGRFIAMITEGWQRVNNTSGSTSRYQGTRSRRGRSSSRSRSTRSNNGRKRSSSAKTTISEE